MPLLLIPAIVLLAVAALLLLWPFALWQRYRQGSARRRALRWLARLNAWVLSVSTALFLAGTLIAGLVIDGALVHGLAGLLAGGVLGWVGIAVTRFEISPVAMFYRPNRWLVLGLTAVLVAKIALTLWQAARRLVGEAMPAAEPVWSALGGPAGLFAAGGLLIGYHLAYAWLLRARVLRYTLPGV